MLNSISITTVLVIINVVASLYAWKNPEIQHKWMLNPSQVWYRRQYYRLFTSGFIHANWGHLLFNMIALWSFGSVVEFYFVELFGTYSSVYFVAMYVLALVVSDLSTLVKYRDVPNYNALGASGAVSAVVFAAIVFAPWEQVYVFLIPMPGILMAVLYLLYSVVGSRQHFGDNINHDAHLYGALFGWLFLFILKPWLLTYFIEQLSQPTFF